MSAADSIRGDQPPVVRFLSGRPTDEEVAAVCAALLVAMPEAVPDRAPAGTPRAQNRRARLGLRLRPGLGAWRRTTPFR